MDRLHLKYVMLNKNNVGIDYTIIIIMRHCMPPPPPPHNKSYDNIDISGLVV